MNPLERLGHKVAEGLDQARSRSDLVAGVRSRFLRRAAQPPRGSTRTRTAVGLAAACALAASATILIIAAWPADGALIATVGRDGEVIRTGQWITAPAGEALPIHFSDGSLIELKPLSGARLVEMDPRGACVLLEKGTMRAEVVHREDTSWRIDVGPYEVTVVGTRFVAAWDPDRQELALDLHEGSVLVLGPMVTDGQRINAGSSFRAWIGEQRVELASLGAERSAADDRTMPHGEPPLRDTVEGPGPATGETSSAGPPEVPPRPDITHTSPAAGSGPDAGAALQPAPSGLEAEPAWKTLAMQGRFDEAIAAAESAGFERVLIGATPAELMLLGDAARLTRGFDRAEQCYIELRQRYPGTTQATKAAFALGRMAFDQQHLYTRSAKWLDLYLEESGGGGLTREALGRLVEAKHRAGDLAGALRAAERYVASYPDGPHAPYARQILHDTDSDVEAP